VHAVRAGSALLKEPNAVPVMCPLLQG